jgi:hypothetical protein
MEPFDPGEGAGEEGGGREAPWERRREQGRGRAFLETWKAASLRPGEFFDGLKTTDLVSPLLFAWLAGGIGSFFGAIWNLLGTFSGQVPQPPAVAVTYLIVAPLVSPLFLFLAAGLVHLGCVIFGCSRNGFEATFRAVAYGEGPAILGAVPILGSIAGTVWSLVIWVIGIARLQRTSVQTAALAVLVPMAAAMLAGCCFVAAAVALIGYGGGFAGR